MRNAQPLMMMWSESLGLGQHVLKGSQHQGKRGPEFVTHVAEEDGLGAIDLRQSLGTLLLRLVSARIRNARSDLPGKQIEKSSIVHVERAVGIERCDQHS